MSRLIKLNSSFHMPSLGLGTWKSDKANIPKVIETALQTGYRHFDCAPLYQNEKQIGSTLKASGIPRQELFLATKLGVMGRAKQAIDRSLKDLQVDYLDLYYLHWPLVPDPKTKKFKIDMEETKRIWGELEGLVNDGRVKSLGVSNFNISQLRQLISSAGIKPAVNQVELHPYLPQNDLIQFCKEEGIEMVAYSPLGGGPGNLLNDPVVVDIANDYGATPAQVLITWGLSRGYSVIPKSGNEERIKSNFEVLDLDDTDIGRLNDLGVHNKRFIDSKSWAGVDVFDAA